MPDSKVQEKIRELVRSRWSTWGRPLTLADLGLQLAREFPRADLQRELLGGKLKNYVAYNLSGDLRIVRHPTNPIVWGLVPGDVKESPESLFAPPQYSPHKVLAPEATLGQQEDAVRPLEKARLPYVRYDYDLWKAFTSPLTDERYIEFGERVVVSNVPRGGVAPDKSFKIEPSDFCSSEDGYPAVAQKIESWAERNKVDISRFKITGRSNKRSLLELMIEALSDDELRQIALPMSVIKILNSKRI